MGGKRFGELEKVTGVTFFRLSPYEQSPFAGIREATARFVKRCRGEFFFITPRKYFLLINNKIILSICPSLNNKTVEAYYYSCIT